jgi:hypothetical protein
VTFLSDSTATSNSMHVFSLSLFFFFQLPHLAYLL